MFQYSFANTNMTIRGLHAGGVIPGNQAVLPVKGFKTGEDLITIARKAPIATTDFSAYGQMVVSMQRNLSVDLVFPLLMNSPENAQLQAWANYFQRQANKDGQLIEPLQVDFEDNMGKDVANCYNGVILAIPALTRGVTVSTVTWVISFEEGRIHRNVGGDFQALGVQTAGAPVQNPGSGIVV